MESSQENYNIEELLPSCWEDDVRMNLLFSSFRNKEVNPKGWTDKMMFWTSLILKWNKLSKSATFSLHKLNMVFQRNGQIPQCLDIVLEEMKRQGQIQSLDNFIFENQRKTWLNRGADLLIRKPIRWGLNLLLSTVRWSDPPNEIFVNVMFLKDMADQVLTRCQNQIVSEWTDSILSEEELWQQCKDICPLMETFELVVMILDKQNHLRILQHSEKEEKIIRFQNRKTNLSSPLSELEVGILNLKQVKQKLEDDIEKLQEEYKGLRDEAQLAVRDKQKNKAANLLRKKKITELSMEKKQKTLENIEGLLHRLQEADSENMVLKGYETGVQVLKSMSDRDLSWNKIDTTLTDLEEVLQNETEIREAMSKPLVGVCDYDTEELEVELDELLKGEQEELTHLNKNQVNSDEELSAFMTHLSVNKHGISWPEIPTTSQEEESIIVHNKPVMLS
ncbi:charged multivesicular body protein 7-like [Limulus polyphemus]|uniref:Charged multivesicular body protein 7 n=1 Tax=Limulus polyphemus TaxID=6850 RepID=A0ABM1BQI0_LIMPO|nr:charged multivesicular body protein 7-like [Limulus polyphemus]XP_013786711.1 charged multivesicular body protein 7-like [Limulus polyphemus]